MRISPGFVLAVGFSMIIFGFFWRIVSSMLHETSIGKAMAFLY